MKVNLSREIKEHILDGLPAASPIEKVFNDTFLRFDSFTVDNKEVSFKYGGRTVFTLSHEADLTNAVLTVTGIEGKMPIGISEV